MSFSIDIQPISTFQQIRITHTTTKNYIDIISKGGILNSWMQTKENWDIIDGNDFASGWENFESNGFKGGKMSPFACRLFQGKYQYINQQYKVEKFYLGDHGIHGILYDAVYDIIETAIQENNAHVILAYHYQGTDKGYPFEYTMQLKWTFFADNKITIETKIINNGNHTIPMMDGWHPYFQLGNSINECDLQFKNKGMLEYDSSLIPTGKLLENSIFDNGAKLENTKLDNGFLMDSKNANCILENEQYKLMIQPNSNYPYLQLYIPDHRKSIAIENLSAAPNCFNNKMGLHVMQPQEIWILETSYQLIIK